jgi:hypothetical protein
MPQSGVAASRGEQSGREDRSDGPGFKRDSKPPPAAAGGVPGRRTVTIRGQGAERNVPRSASRRPAERRYERSGFRPDRVAMWAVLLGLMLIIAAATSAHAATLHALVSLG